MKISKKFFICFLLVLMLFICVNATSASDTLETNLTSEDTVDLPSVDAVDASQDKLSSSGDTFVVDGNGGGDYTTISAAVSAATGGETIFIKNGNYTESLTFTNSVNIVGESKDGVTIKTGSSNALIATTSENSPMLSFENLTFTDSARGSSGVISLMGSGDVNFTNCIFKDLSSKYGAIQTNTAGTITISKCTFDNIKEKSNSPGTGLMYLNGAGTTNIYDCVITNCGYDASSGQMNALIYEYAKTGTVNIERTTIKGTTGAASSIIRSAGKINVKDSKIIDNVVYLSSAGYVGDSLFYVTGELNIETSVIANNSGPKLLLYKNTAAAFTMNYCNVQENTFDGGFADASAGDYDVNNNWWGSNTLPEGITATTWIVEDNGEYALNNGSALDVIVPSLNEEPEEGPVVLPEGTIYVSATGDDANDGSSEATAVATIAHAVKIAMNKTNKTSTIYILNGDYTTAPIDVTEANITFIGQEKGKVIIHGNGKYIFDVYGDYLISKFENIDFVDSYSPSGNMGALRLYADYSEFTVNNCNFRNISAKYGAIDLQADYGNINIANCVIEDVTGSTSMSAIVYINGESTSIFDNIEITNCRLDENYASENPTNYLRALFYVASKTATVTLTNSKISNNYGAIYGGVIESKSKLTVDNIVISDNVVNTSVNGVNGGEYLIWASDDAADISISNCVITDNTIVKTTKGLLYNQKGKMSIEFCDVSNNNVEKFVGGTGTLTADNNWWGTNDQPDTKVNKWVVMNVALNDSDLKENNKITLTIDFNHVKTASGDLEELTGGEIPKNSYSIDLSAKNGEINPTNVVVNKGQTVTKTFTVTELNDEITLTCDGANIETITIEAIPPYRGIIYVNTTGNDANEGSIDAPVATVAKAIELANKGSHEIIIDEGTYVGKDYAITSNLTVTGNGKVTLDANNEGRLFNMAYGTVADKIELHNLILTNANGFGAAVYSLADELILDNVTIVNNQASNYLITSKGKLTIKDSEISNSMSGDVIQQTGNGDILINNTVFKDNSVVDSSSVMAVVNINSGSGNLVIENSKFINNTARQGVIKGNFNYNVYVKGTEFINNTNTVSVGGAIYASGNTLNVVDSVFVNNKAARSGGAINVGYRTTAVVDKSVFVNNIANTMGDDYYGDAIYNGNKLTVNNCVLLTNAQNYIIYNDGEDNVVNAQNNWWGTNDNPKDLVASGTYEDDDWEEQDCAEVDVSKWVTMDASFVPDDAQAGDGVTVVATFSNPNLPDGIRVTFTSTSGYLDTVVSTVGGKASTTYTIDATDDAITATSRNATVEMPIVGPSSNTVTQDNFYSFFDEDGMLLSNVTYDELIFKGNFSDLAAGYIIIDRSITITGKDAILKDMGIVIASEDVALDKLTLIAGKSLGDLITVGASNVNLTNLDITYITGDESANAINVQSTETISNVNILNNNIYFENHATDDENLVTAINLNDVEDVFVDGNNITASMPSLYVGTYDYTYFMMGLCYVNPIRLWEASSAELTNNKVDVVVNSYDASYPTVQALYIVGSEDVLIKGNNFTMVDTLTPAGTAIYLYAVECGFSSGIEFIENNFNISTTGGKSGAGSAYALQVATSEATFIGNNITCDSNGPNLGIYSPYGFGPAKDLVIKDNFLNISGYATESGDFALISGIEVQTGYATIYNNTIYVQNKADYGEKYPVSGISAIQYSASTLSFDIQDNVIFTNGKYAVEMLYAPQSAIVTGNFLVAYDLVGDKAVYFKSGKNNVVENNTPTNVVTNETFYDFFDSEGNLKTDLFKELVFNGTFSGLTDKIVLNMPISVIGIDAVLNDIAINVASDRVKLNNLTLNSDKEFADNNGALIYATGANIEINDVVVNYTAPSEVEAIGIYANAANNFKLTNSEIVYVATNPGSKHNYGLEVRDSENVTIENNKIDATLPAVDVAFGSGEGIDVDLVLAVGIQGGENINFTKNTVTVNTNGGVGSWPTIDAIMIHSAENVMVNLNTISHIDTTTSDTARYYNCVDIYSSTATVDSNNILVNTTTGIERSGTAYPVQLTGPFTVIVSNNNLTSISKGPNAGIYASNWGGYGDLTIVGNNIDITGYAAEHNYALVSGIESQVDITRIYDNVIKTHNIANYSDANQIYGISIAQYYGGDHAADIRGNNITTDGKYAVYYAHAINTNVTLNELLAHELEGNAAAFIASGDNNYIDVNFPPYIPDIIIEADNIWIGNDVTVYVTIANTTGNVTIKVNDKEFKDLILVDGKVSQFVNASDLVAGINNVVVTFTSTDGAMRSGNETGAFYVLDGVVTQDTYTLYFNQEDNGKLVDAVPIGATLDFQGSIINPDQAITVQMNVNKPVNIVSTTGDAYVDLNTTAGSLLGESPGNSFAVTNGGSGSNVTGIYFHNTQIWISNTHDVVLDNISVVVEDQRVGSGVGATTIRDNSSNVVLKNSYLYTRNNGGSTTFTMSWTTNCTIDNCTVKAEGNVGNLIYLNTFNIVGAPTGVPLNNYNKVINNRIYGKEGSGISVGLMVEGSHNLIMNNTLYKSSISTSFGGSNPADNVYVGNTMTDGSGLTAQTKSIVYGNIVTGALSTGTGSVVYDNIVGGKLTVGQNAKAYNNTVGNGLTTGGTDAIIENNTIVGAVTINKLRTTFVGNDVTGTVTVSANNNIIKGNKISTTGNYAVDLGSKTGNNVTDNYLTASVFKGDKAVKFTNANNVVENNLPAIEINVVAQPVWIGSNGVITVNVVNGTGNVTIKVNDKEYIVELDENGTANKEIPAEDLIVGENNVTVTYESVEYATASDSTVLAVLDGVVTQDNYMYYFNQEDNGKLFDCIPDGATLDFQGSIINPDQAITVQMNVNKPVNIISSTKDAYVDLNTTAGSLLGESPGNSFAVTKGGSGSNVTGIYFHNTQIWISNTHDVVLDNISVVVEDQRVGSGVGATTIRDNSSNVVLKNSYLYTRNNGGSTTFTMSWTTNCTIDNCTVKAEGNVGNLIYLNIFNIVGAPTGVPLNNYNKVINNKIYGKEGSGISVGLMVEGSHNLIKNNTLYKSSISTSFGGQNPADNVYVGNTMTDKGSLTALANSIVYENIVDGALSTGANSVAYDNIVGGKMTVGAGANAFENIVGNGLTTGGANAVIDNNIIVGAVTINKVGTTFVGNNVTGTVTVSANNNVIRANNITSTGNYAVDLGSKTGNNVTENRLVAKEYEGDDAVKYVDGNIVKDNYRFPTELSVSVEDIIVGQTAVINVSINKLVTGTVQVIVNGKKYMLNIENGSASVEIPNLIASQYSVGVSYDGDDFVRPSTNSTTFNVAKINSDAIITVTDAKIGEDANVTVAIENATGDVTLIVNGNSNDLHLTDGIAKYTIKSVAPGTYSIVVIYGGDENHEFVSNSTSLVVEKIATEIALDNVTVDWGAPIPIKFTIGEFATGKVFFDFNGDKFVEMLENGTIDIEIECLVHGIYNLSVSYEGDANYESCQKTVQITVNAIDAGLKANASDINVGENATINIEINSEATGAVVVILDKEYAVNIVDGKGYVSFANLANGTYAATVKFAGDNKFAANETVVTFNVLKVEIPSDINVSMDIPEGTTAPEFTVQLPEDATGNFSVTVDGNQTYTQELVNGSATVKVPELAVGDHTIVSSYSGDNKYAGFTSDSKQVTIPKASIPGGEDAINVTAPEGTDSPTYSINLPGATGNLTVTVDGKDNYTEALANGSASVTVPGLSQGDHNITVTYSGDAKFSNLTKDTTFHVPVVKLTKNKDLTVLYTAKSYYKVLVTADGKAVAAGEKVAIKFNGKDYTAKTDKNGYVSFKLPTVAPKSAKYTITATYKGIKVSNKVKVKSIVKAKKVKVKKSKKVNKIKVTLKKVNGKYLKGKKLKLKLKGKTLKAKTNKKGKATFKVKKNVLKKLKVGKKYKYKVTYLKDTVTKKLTVKK